jgi:hypothetical protein
MSAITIELGPRLLALALLWTLIAAWRIWQQRTPIPPQPHQPQPPATPGCGSDRRGGPGRRLAEQIRWSRVTAVDPVTQIIELVAERFGVSPAAILSPSRAQPTALARQIAMRLARELTDLSYTQLGARFHRDHSTVIHAVKATEGMLLDDLREAIGEALHQPAAAGSAKRQPPRNQRERDTASH